MKGLLLNSEKRELFGRKVKKLRRQGVIPANVYGKKVKSQAVQVKKADFEKIFKEVGETQVFDLSLGEDTKPVLIHNIQKDPIDGSVIHIDFLQVDLKQKVTASIPIVRVGESPAEKQGLGTVVFYIDEVEVEALPTDLPEKIEVDLSSLKEVDQVVLIKDLVLDRRKVEIKADSESVVIKVEPFKEEVEVKEEAVGGEVSAEGPESGESEFQEEEPPAESQEASNS